MSSPTNPTSSGNQGDPWEQLAEDLFGLEYGKEHGSRESSSPAVEPVSRAATAPQNVRVEERPAPASITSPAEAEPQHSQAEPALTAEPAFKEPESSQEPRETSSPAAAETGSPQDSYWDALANWNWDESDGAASKARSEAPRSSGGPPARGGPRGRDDRRDRRGGEKPQRQASESSTSDSSPPGSSRPPAASSSSGSTRRSSTTADSGPRAPRPVAPAAGDDFGLGLDESTADFSAPKEPHAVEGRGDSEPRRPVHDTTSRAESSSPAPTADRGEHRPGTGEPGTDPGSGKPEEGEFPRKRRRRRRRRSRGGDREVGSTTGTTPGATTTPASAASGDEWEDSDGPESDAVADEPQTPIANPREEIKDEVEGDRHVRRGRRNGPRNERTRQEGTGRRPNTASSDITRSEDRLEDGPGEFEEEPLLVGGGVEEPAGDDDGEDDASEQAVSYENVPTWEEAISYLLHPNTVQVESGPGNGSVPPRGAPPADQPRQTRHMGGQKHRR